MTKLPRNPHAVRAALRVAGPMKDRRAPRGGARNEARELLAEAAADAIPLCGDCAALLEPDCTMLCRACGREEKTR